MASDGTGGGKLRCDDVSPLAPELHVHLVASATNARYVEYFPDDKVLNFRKLLNRQLEAKEGHLLLPQTPGLGFEFDESSIAKFGLNRPQPWAIVQLRCALKKDRCLLTPMFD